MGERLEAARGVNGRSISDVFDHRRSRRPGRQLAQHQLLTVVDGQRFQGGVQAEWCATKRRKRIRAQLVDVCTVVGGHLIIVAAGRQGRPDPRDQLADGQRGGQCQVGGSAVADDGNTHLAGCGGGIHRQYLPMSSGRCCGWRAG